MFKEQCEDIYSILQDDLNIHGAYRDYLVHSKAPCPLLIDDKCAAYPVCPMICRLYGASHTYRFCSKIRKKCSSFFSKKLDLNELYQHTVDMPAPDYIEGIDYLYQKSQQTWQKPFPLFWWFAEFDNYKSEYEIYKLRTD